MQCYYESSTESIFSGEYNNYYEIRRKKNNNKSLYLFYKIK